MTRSIRLAICLSALMSACTALAQSQISQIDEATAEPAVTEPAAFVYVSSITNPNGPTYIDNVYAFTAAANGKLTPVTGSPFKENIFSLAVNGKYLFGGNGSGNIDSYLMETNGALHYEGTINPTVYNPGGCGNPGDFRIDHSGEILYNVSEDPDCFGTHFQYFKINDTTGKLEYTGDTAELGTSIYEIDFLGNNKFAYSPICTIYDHEEVGYTTGLERHSDGDLTEVNLGNLGPVTPQSENSYCPLTFATDPTNHMAALLQDEDADGDLYGLPVIATYTARTNGALTTTSTYKNMPVLETATQAYEGFSMRMSPSGKYLAVGAINGLEIFHFNGGTPATKYKVLLAGKTIDEVYWDNNNHLFTLASDSPGAGKLYVYTVTSTSVTEATGSPYSIPNPVSVIVQPK
jgi:hypothetical protein